VPAFGVHADTAWLPPLPGADGTSGKKAVPGASQRPGSVDTFRRTEHRRSLRRDNLRAAECLHAAKEPARRHPPRPRLRQGRRGDGAAAGTMRRLRRGITGLLRALRWRANTA